MGQGSRISIFINNLARPSDLMLYSLTCLRSRPPVPLCGRTRGWNQDYGEAKSMEINNRRARYDYFILDTFEAGIVLKGTEVKSIRAGKVSLQDSYAKIEAGEVYLMNSHISPYDQGSHFNHDPKRPRKLLLHNHEIKRLIGKTQGQPLTLIPLRMYFKKGKTKVEIALAKGKRKYDRRRDIKDKEIKRQVREQS